MVLDRLFLWLYTIASVIGSFVILLTAPALYDDSSDMAIKYSLVAQQLYGIPDFWMASLTCSSTERERDIQHTATNYFHCARLKNKKAAAAAAASRPAQTMSYIYLETTAQSQQSKSKPISPTLNIIYLVYIDSLSLSLSLPRYNIYIIILYSDAYTLCVWSTQRLPVYDTAQQTTFVFFSSLMDIFRLMPFCVANSFLRMLSSLPSCFFCLCNNRPNNFCDVVIF